MDIASLIGIVACLGLVMFGIVSGDDGMAAIGFFVDPPSMLITFGGSFMATMASVTLPDFIGGLKSFTLIFKTESANIPEMITKIIDLSNVARKEGLLSLEEAASDLDDAFMKKGILLIVDGTELVSIEGRHKDKIGFWETLGSMGPAWGMIGTLVGLVIMLQHMTDPSSLGPSMATALITTFYGSLLANWICGPVGNKLKSKNAAEIQAKEIMIEGLLSIQAGENPRVIEEKLKSFMSPKDRPTATEEGAGGEA